MMLTFSLLIFASRFVKIWMLFTLLFFLTACSAPTHSQDTEIHPAQQVISCHATKQKKRYQLELVASGTMGDSAQKAFALHYLSNRKLQIPEVRKLLILSVEEFLNMANSDEKLQQLVDNHPVTIKNLRYNIGFVTIDGSLQDPPNIAYVYLADEKICYCYYDSLFGKFINYDDVEEPYEQALEIVTQGKE